VIENARVLIVGLGGLGCPATLALSRAGVGTLVLVDDDPIEASNLHRQILYREEHVGKDKITIAKETLVRRGRNPDGVELVHSRFLPDNARELAKSVDLVIEGADNFATKFLVADACRLEKKPVVHGAAIRWRATAWLVGENGRPCYRCLFEDLPGEGANATCNEAGVMGPVVGFAGALMADLALRCLSGDESARGVLFTYDGKSDHLREVSIPARPNCALCGENPSIFGVEESRYTATHSAA
jgi:molybdopterin/thiamine biosynthesis adenylyltransferase